MTPPRSGGVRTVVEVHADPGGVRASCRTVPGLLSPRVLTMDDRGAHVALVATRALLLAGDHVEIELVVGPGAWLTVTEVTGTVAYDAGGAASSWTVSARVGPGAALLWEAPPFVVATGARVERATTVDLAPGAVAGWREAVVIGRTDEIGGVIRSVTRVAQEGAPLLVDDVVLGDPGTDLVTRGPHRVMDTATVVGFRPTSLPDAVTPDGVTVLDLAGPGAIARTLTTRAHESAVDTRWLPWRDELRDVHRRRARGDGAAS